MSEQPATTADITAATATANLAYITQHCYIFFALAAHLETFFPKSRRSG